MRSEETSNAPIFVVGNARSGTTLLARLLDTHPRLAVYDETHFFYFFADHASRLDLRRDDVLHDLLDLVFATRLENTRESPFARLDEAAVRARIEASERTLGSIFDVLMSQWCKRRGKQRWGDKSPMHLFEIEAIVAAFPDARFVHIVRDPRAVVASIRRAGMSPGQPFHRHADMWRYSMQKGNRGFECVPSGQWIELHYEDLVADPEASLRRLCAFLGETYSESMLADHRRAGDANANLLRARPDAANLEQPINRASLGKWQRLLTPRQVGLIESINAHWMKHYGYRPQSRQEGVDFGTRAFVSGYRLSAPLRDYLRKQRWRRRTRRRYAATLARLRQPEAPARG